MKARDSEINFKDLLNFHEVVKKAGIGDSSIRYYLREGILKGIRLGRQWFVKEKDLKKFLKGKGIK